MISGGAEIDAGEFFLAGWQTNYLAWSDRWRVGQGSDDDRLGEEGTAVPCPYGRYVRSRKNLRR